MRCDPGDKNIRSGAVEQVLGCGQSAEAKSEVSVKKTRFTEQQMVTILREADAKPVPDKGPGPVDNVRCKRGKVKPDDFTRSRLFAVSGGYCGNPDCARVLFREVQGARFHLGEIAHIFAAGDKGPRANPTVTARERGEFENLILLCALCYTEVDKVPNVYTDDIVRHWKEQHSQTLVRVFGVHTYPERALGRIAVEPERTSCAQTCRPTFLRTPHSTDRMIPAVVSERDDQMSGPPPGGRRRSWPTATVSRHPWPVYGFDRLRAAGRVTARDVPPVVFLLSRTVACREASVKPSRRQTPACGGARRGRSARFGGGSPESAGRSRVLPRAWGDGCWDGSAPRRGTRAQARIR